MTKFHINKHGVPAPCKAKEGNCPLGGSETHFNSQEEAQVHADNQGEQKHGLLPGVESKYNPSKEEFKDVALREVSIELKDGTVLSGIANSSKWEDDEKTVTVRVGRPYGVPQEVNLEDIANLEANEHRYYDSKYRENLRENNKARVEYRFTEEELNKHKGKFVEVNYDGKRFDGEVLDTHYDGEHNSGLIIKSTETGEIKHIKNYRLRDIELTGDNELEHKGYQKMKALENELLEDIDDYSYGSSDAPEGSDTTPTDELRTYFKASIKKHEGEDIDLSKIDHDWVDEVEYNKDSYRDSSRYYHDFHRGGGQWDEWSENSEEAFNDDIRRAEEANEFYDSRKDYIDNLVNKVQEVDWTQYGKSQKEGEIDALNYMYDGDIAVE